MSYSRLFENLVLFSGMDYEQKTACSTIIRDQRHADMVRSLKRGHCFGLTVNYLAHHHFGNRDWWKQYLYTVTNWDGKQTSLSLPVKGVRSEKVLGDLINRVMHYVLPYQASSRLSRDLKLSMLPESVVQDNILRTDSVFLEKSKQKKSYFEYLDSKGVIHSIKQYRKIGGYLPKQLLLDIFSEESLKKALIVISNEDHSVGLAFVKKSTWLVYDCKYEIEDLASMDMTGTLDECIDEIIRIQGESFCIEFASFEAGPALQLFAFEEALKSPMMFLFHHKGFLHFVDLPLEEVLVFLESLKEKDRFIAKIVIYNSFTETFGAYNGLQQIFYNHNVLFQILKIARESIYYDEMRQNIISALLKEDDDKNIVFTMLICRVENLRPVLDFLVNDRASLLLVIELLSKNAKNGLSPWAYLNKEQIKDVFNFFLVKMTDTDMDFYADIPDAHNNKTLPYILLSFLFQAKVGDAESLLDIVKKKIPKILPAIVQMALEMSDGFDILRELFTQRISFSSPQKFWDLLFDCPAIKEDIKKHLVQYIRGMNLETITRYHEMLCTNDNKENIASAWFNKPAEKQSAFLLFLQKEIRREYESYNFKTQAIKKRKTLRI